MVFGVDFDREVFLLIQRVYLNKLIDITPVDTGQLKRSWDIVKVSETEYYLVNLEHYAKFRELGTGLHRTEFKKNVGIYVLASNRSRIFPKTKNALAFKIGGTQFVVSSVAGIKGLHKFHEIFYSSKNEQIFSEGLNKIFTKYIEKEFK